MTIFPFYTKSIFWEWPNPAWKKKFSTTWFPNFEKIPRHGKRIFWIANGQIEKYNSLIESPGSSFSAISRTVRINFNVIDGSIVSLNTKSTVFEIFNRNDWKSFSWTYATVEFKIMSGTSRKWLIARTGRLGLFSAFMAAKLVTDSVRPIIGHRCWLLNILLVCNLILGIIQN